MIKKPKFIIQGNIMAISIQLIIVLLILFLFNFYYINRNKWLNVFGCLFFLLLMVPVEAQGIISGTPYSVPGVLNLSLAGYNLIIIFLCIFITKKKILNFTKKTFISILLCLIFIIGMRFMVDGFSAPSNKMFDNYCLPVLGAILMISFLKKEDLNKLLKFIYYLIFFNALIAGFEYIIGHSLFFHNYYLTNVEWYQNIYNSTFYGVPFRSTSLLGHPLSNGAYFIIALVYLCNVTKIKLNIKNIFQFLVLAFAVFATNSRIAIAVAIVYIVYMLLREKRIVECLILACIGIIIFFNIDLNEIYSKIFIRDASGSSLSVRILAISNIFKIPFSTFLFGTGYNNTKNLLSTLGFSTNLEISFLIILLENGILSFVVWLKMIFQLYSRKMEKIYNGIYFKSMVNGMILCFIIVSATSNSIGDSGTLNYVFFGMFAFSNIMSIKYEKSVDIIK